MIYEFVDVDTDERVELNLPIGKAHMFGTVQRLAGRNLRREMSLPKFLIEKDLHFVSDQLPKNWPFAKQHDAEGRARFDSVAEVRECLAHAQDHGEQILYNDALDDWGKEGRHRVPHGAQ